MTVNNSSAHTDIRAGTMLQGGRWIAFAGCAYAVLLLLWVAAVSVVSGQRAT